MKITEPARNASRRSVNNLKERKTEEMVYEQKKNVSQLKLKANKLSIALISCARYIILVLLAYIKPA